MKFGSKIFSVFVAASVGNCYGGRRSSHSSSSSTSHSSDSSSDLPQDDNDGHVEVDCHDLNIRFSKFAALEEGDEEVTRILPMDKFDYPIGRNSDIEEVLTTRTNAVSVVNDLEDYEIKYKVEELIDNVGGEPDHPQSKIDAAYWEKLREVIRMRVIDEKEPGTALADKMLLPLRWADYSVDDVSEAVHDEYPGLHQAEFLDDLVTRGIYGPIEFDSEAVAGRSGGRFLRGIVALADLHTWSVGVVGPHNFAAKWYAGRARPEEVAFEISEGHIHEKYVPDDILQSINSMGLTKATDFARYPEGSPRHPSWPAMHSAASNISFWLQIVMNLTPEQLCEAKKVDYAVAYARTVAAVHFPDDNIAGLQMGQIIVEQALAEHLCEKYDSDEDYVADKIKAKLFDWAEYDPLEDCSSLTTAE